jgi:Flp pilus assembly protein TadD
VLALALLYAIAAPRIADDRVDKAYAAIGRGDLERAIERADEARTFNPVALAPLFARASAYDVLGNQVEATHTLYAAVRLQPKNPASWYELGVFELTVTRKLNNAFNHLDNAYELDPNGPAGGPLDEVRQIFFEEKQKCFAAGTC